jgi:hypothetical protein
LNLVDEYNERQINKEKEKMNEAIFVFEVEATDPEDQDYIEGMKAVVTIGTIEDWETDHCVSDGYSAENQQKLDEIVELFNFEELSTSTYGYYGALSVEELCTAMASHPLLKLDENFISWLNNLGNGQAEHRSPYTEDEDMFSDFDI